MDYTWAYVLASIILFVALLWLLISYLAYRRAFYSSTKRDEDIHDIPDGEQYNKARDVMIALIDEMDAIPYERVYTTSHDGLKLSARYYHISDDAPLQIQFPGYRGSSVRDFCGGHKLAREYGFNTLVVDQRAHGMSEGTTITFGINERHDCLRWIEYACERFGNIDIHLAGVSMGAATVLLAAEFELPDNIKGIIADCPYSSPADIIKKVIKDMKLPPKIAYPFAFMGAKIFGNFDLNSASVVDAIKKATKPILIIHGEEDRLVPCDMSKKIETAAQGKAIFVSFPNAGHGISYIEDPKRYAEVVSDFLASCK